MNEGRWVLLIASEVGGTDSVSDRAMERLVEAIREDLVNPKLLYTGTHFGIFASFDQGAHWVRIGDVPPVRVDDIQIHPRTSDLVRGMDEKWLKNMYGIALVPDAVFYLDVTPEELIERNDGAVRLLGMRETIDQCRHDFDERISRLAVAEHRGMPLHGALKLVAEGSDGRATPSVTSIVEAGERRLAGVGG